MKHQHVNEHKGFRLFRPHRKWGNNKKTEEEKGPPNPLPLPQYQRQKESASRAKINSVFGSWWSDCHASIHRLTKTDCLSDSQRVFYGATIFEMDYSFFADACLFYTQCQTLRGAVVPENLHNWNWTSFRGNCARQCMPHSSTIEADAERKNSAHCSWRCGAKLAGRTTRPSNAVAIVYARAQSFHTAAAAAFGTLIENSAWVFGLRKIQCVHF